MPPAPPVRGKPAIAKIPGVKHPRDRRQAAGSTSRIARTRIPADIGASGTICFSSGIENAIYEMAKKQTISPAPRNSPCGRLVDSG